MTEGSSGGQDDGADGGTGTGGSGGTVGGAPTSNGAAEKPGVISIDGTVPGRALTVGGPGMAWPPPGVSAVPAPGQACSAKLGASGAIPKTIPAAYYESCAGCHGPAGAGSSSYPSILRPKDFASFQTTLRSGKVSAKGVMPAFDEEHLSDDNLARIYAFVAQVPIIESNNCTPVAPMSAAAQADALSRGLAAWRKTDASGHDGVGCFQCHAADGLTFAYFGFSDGDILRRANKHLDAQDSMAIVDMVHAFRDKYNIVKRDPLGSRPFQPGGRVTDGNNARERDLSFGQELSQMGLTVATSYVNSGKDAQKAAAELDAINLHALPLPIPFNHLAEDMYHNAPGGPLDCNDDIDGCKDHGSLSDWMPIQPHIPTNLTQFYATESNYINNPSIDNFYRVYGAIPADRTMPGTYPSGYNYSVDDNKYRAEFILDYCIRREVMNLPGCYTTGSSPFDPNKRITHIWGEGENANLFGTGLSKQPQCDIGKANCDPPQAPHFFTKLTPGARISDSFQRLRVPWFTMHWAHFDPSLLVTGDATIQQDEYFTRDIFWSNNDQDFGGKAVNDTYSIFGAFEVLMHNIKVLSMPETAACSKIPYTHPDLGTFPCTAVDLRSGYYPQLCNFAEGKNWYNESKYQLAYVPKDAARKAIYQRIGGNMYRIFLWGLIDKLQEDNWMCDASMQGYRIKRAQNFLAQNEIVAENGPQDQEMFATLAALMAKSRKACPPLDTTKKGTY